MDTSSPLLSLRSLSTQWTSLDVWLEISVIIISAVIAYLLHRSWGKGVEHYMGADQVHWFRRITLRGSLRLILPTSMLIIVLLARATMQALDRKVILLNVIVPLLVSLAIIRLMVYLLRQAVRTGQAMRAWEYVISTSMWLLVALHLLGLLPGILKALDAVGMNVGETYISILAVFKLVISIGLLILISLWLARMIENRLQRSTVMDISMRIALAKVSRFSLITAAFLVALNTVGIDLTALTVFGGALGVGLGFGLQRIASNFISGFILIFDRSIKPGDVITIGQSFGWVQELRARYIVVRNRDGVETLIPNENLITTDVINWSYSDKEIRLKMPVQISYKDDPELAMQLMENAGKSCARIVTNPAPVCRLMEFADSGIQLELRAWITDPENGVNNVVSEVNLAIWRTFKEHGITIPFPQRDVHLYQQVSPD
jgi:small-conductance mechanosensitive channel